ncbi:hypothetical protein M9H77_15643 [Catharanthus roseus]|uniref:Uncharacterized protein n=1 Tax=Catharanthus roseus TaxID=4058 RepID=A0ACC0AZL6_CATRO|nr:hypothetical protein M9H77_15643 [Catharanthus roseus]
MRFFILIYRLEFDKFFASIDRDFEGLGSYWRLSFDRARSVIPTTFAFIFLTLIELPNFSLLVPPLAAIILCRKVKVSREAENVTIHGSDEQKRATKGPNFSTKILKALDRCKLEKCPAHGLDADGYGPEVFQSAKMQTGLLGCSPVRIGLFAQYYHQVFIRT